MIGCMLVVFIGIIVSFITGYKKPSDVNPRTVNPLHNFLCKRFLPKTLHDKFLVKSIEEYDKEQMITLGRGGSPEFTRDSRNGKVNPAFVASDDKELALVSSARGATNIQVTTTPELKAVRAFGESPISDRRKTAANGVTGSPMKALSEDEAATPL
uniref:Secreted protein n=1 Tax=Ixodes ricinus TaxID=34613 RepID=A0A147BWK4_IXORI